MFSFLQESSPLTMGKVKHFSGHVQAANDLSRCLLSKSLLYCSVCARFITRSVELRPVTCCMLYCVLGSVSETNYSAGNSNIVVCSSECWTEHVRERHVTSPPEGDDDINSSDNDDSDDEEEE